jgi:hypothetical protein
MFMTLMWEAWKGMSRPFDFSDTTKREAFRRQWNLCAHCGRNLANLYDHAHHVIPNQSGNVSNPADAFLRSVDNCVILCDMCHERVHQDARYRTGAVAPPEYYPYSHGNQVQQHTLWVTQLNNQWRRMFPSRGPV